jgi:hypothetical protein
VLVLGDYLFGRKDAGDRAGPGFGIRINLLPLLHEQRSGALQGLYPLQLYRRDHPTHSDKSFQLVR